MILGVVSLLWLLGLVWVWLAHASLGACTEFGRATLLESWELALSLAEQPCCGAGIMVAEFVAGMLHCVWQGNRRTKLSWDVVLRLRAERWVRMWSEDAQ